jgi:hypothetical protein
MYPLHDRRTGQLAIDDFRPPAVIDVSDKKTGADDGGRGFATREEYELTARLRVVYWANRAEHQTARQHAEKVLLHRLYEPVLKEIAELRKTIYDRDPHAAIAVCERIEKALGV